MFLIPVPETELLEALEPVTLVPLASRKVGQWLQWHLVHFGLKRVRQLRQMLHMV